MLPVAQREVAPSGHIDPNRPSLCKPAKGWFEGLTSLTSRRVPPLRSFICPSPMPNLPPCLPSPAQGTAADTQTHTTSELADRQTPKQTRDEPGASQTDSHQNRHVMTRTWTNRHSPQRPLLHAPSSAPRRIRLTRRVRARSSRSSRPELKPAHRVSVRRGDPCRRAPG